jgi:hypothetical protein
VRPDIFSSASRAIHLLFQPDKASCRMLSSIEYLQQLLSIMYPLFVSERIDWIINKNESVSSRQKIFIKKTKY